MGQPRWSDDTMLMRGERRLRHGAARQRIDSPPGWWEGCLILTSERLSFLPDVESDGVSPAACWLSEVEDVRAEGRHLHVSFGGSRATFDLPGTWLPVRRAAGWAADIAKARDGARRRPLLADPRRAAG
jgi:hypothetical protein